MFSIDENVDERVKCNPLDKVIAFIDGKKLVKENKKWKEISKRE